MSNLKPLEAAGNTNVAQAPAKPAPSLPTQTMGERPAELAATAASPSQGVQAEIAINPVADYLRMQVSNRLRPDFSPQQRLQVMIEEAVKIQQAGSRCTAADIEAIDRILIQTTGKGFLRPDATRGQYIFGDEADKGPVQLVPGKPPYQATSAESFAMHIAQNAAEKYGGTPESFYSFVMDRVQNTPKVIMGETVTASSAPASAPIYAPANSPATTATVSGAAPGQPVYSAPPGAVALAPIMMLDANGNPVAAMDPQKQQMLTNLLMDIEQKLKLPAGDYKIGSREHRTFVITKAAVELEPRRMQFSVMELEAVNNSLPNYVLNPPLHTGWYFDAHGKTGNREVYMMHLARDLSYTYADVPSEKLAKTVVAADTSATNITRKKFIPLISPEMRMTFKEWTSRDLDYENANDAYATVTEGLVLGTGRNPPVYVGEAGPEVRSAPSRPERNNGGRWRFHWNPLGGR